MQRTVLESMSSGNSATHFQAVTALLTSLLMHSQGILSGAALLHTIALFIKINNKEDRALAVPNTTTKTLNKCGKAAASTRMAR